MIALAKTNNGKIVAFGVGKITSDPEYRKTSSDDTICNFYLLADKVGKGKEAVFDSYKVSFWNDMSAYASQFEKGDTVFVFGLCKKDEYWTNRNKKDTYEIVGQFIVPVDIGQTVLQLQQVMMTLNSGEVSLPKSDNNASQDGFTDFSNMQLPPEFDDIEPSI